MTRTAEIIGYDGEVHYRRPEGHPLIDEARRTPGVKVRFTRDWIVELDGWTPVTVHAATRSQARYAAFKLLRKDALNYRLYSDERCWRENLPFKEFCQRTRVR